MIRNIQTSEQALKEIEDRWTLFVGLIATGERVAAALTRAKIAKPIFEGLTRTSKVHKTQYEEAKTGYLRSLWDDDALDTVFAAIADGTSIKAAAELVGLHHRQLLVLTTRDPVIFERFEEAMKVKALSFGEEIIGIVDDDSDDMTMDGKGNTAAVNRSKLRMEGRQYAMNSWYSTVFSRDGGGRRDVNVSVVVNHAERLQAARDRRDRGVTVDAAVDGEIVPADPAPPGAAAPRQISYAAVVEAAEAAPWDR